MNIFLSLLFVASFFALFFGVYLFEKTKQNINAVIWIVPSLFICFSLLAVFCGIINMFKIPINLVTGSIGNLLISAVFWYFIAVKKRIQGFYFKIQDLIAFLVIISIAVFYSIGQFGIDIHPNYETSDPFIHLQAAMDIINKGNLNSMFFSALINSLLIRVFSVVIPLTYSYKVFIVIDMAFFAMSGLVYYSVASNRTNGIVKRIIALVLCFFYMISYPLNNMVFGFCYLGISVSLIAVVLMLLSEYNNSEFNNYFLTSALMSCMLAISMSYILFAPAVYIATFIVVAKLFLKNKKLFSGKHILQQISIFLIPCVLSLYYFVINNKGFSIGGVAGEGYIYRDIISNFFFLIFPVIAYLVKSAIEKDLAPDIVFFVAFSAYFVVAFFLMLKGNLSTYYFYKTYYPLSLICFLMAFEYVNSIKKEQIYVPICYVATVSLLFGISEAGIETKLVQRNPLYCNRTAVHDLFDIYHFNTSKIFSQDKDNREKQWDMRMELYNYVVDNCNPDNNVYLADSWLNVYWYEAVTNQRFSPSYTWINMDDFKEFYKNCEYVVIIPESEDYKDNIDVFGNISEVLYENEIGYVARIK